MRSASSSACRAIGFIFLLISIPNWPAHADSGKPVAVRWWGQALVTIETYWNLHIAIDPYELRIGYDDPGVRADAVLVTHNHFDHNNLTLIGGAALPVPGLDDGGQVIPVDVVLGRHPNEPLPTLRPFHKETEYSPHAVRIRGVAAFHDQLQGKKRGKNTMFVIEVDGVRILHCGDLGKQSVTPLQLNAIGKIDVLLIPVGGVYTVDGPLAAAIVEQLQPHYVIPIHYQTPELALELQNEDGFIAVLPA